MKNYLLTVFKLLIENRYFVDLKDFLTLHIFIANIIFESL